MIKVIAFDFIGVLATEKDDVLQDYEDKIERLFGKNTSNEDFIKEASIYTNKDIVKVTKDIINKLYLVINNDVISKLKKEYPNTLIIVASNHVSYVKDFINEHFNVDDVIISADIHKTKPNSDFYEYILNKYNIKSNELLFLDDRIDNINAASKLGINTIHVMKDIDLYNKIKEYL